MALFRESRLADLGPAVSSGCAFCSSSSPSSSPSTSSLQDAYARLREIFNEQLSKGIFKLFITEQHIILENMHKTFDEETKAKVKGVCRNESDFAPTDDIHMFCDVRGDDTQDFARDNDSVMAVDGMDDGMASDDDEPELGKVAKSDLVLDGEQGIKMLLPNCQIENFGLVNFVPRVQLTRLEDMGHIGFGYSPMNSFHGPADDDLSPPKGDSAEIEIAVEDSVTGASSFVEGEKTLKSLLTGNSESTINDPSIMTSTPDDDHCFVMNSSIFNRKIKHIADLKMIRVNTPDDDDDDDDEDELTMSTCNLFVTGDEIEAEESDVDVDPMADASSFILDGTAPESPHTGDFPTSDDHCVVMKSSIYNRKKSLVEDLTTIQVITSDVEEPIMLLPTTSTCTLFATSDEIKKEEGGNSYKLTNASKQKKVVSIKKSNNASTCLLCGISLKNMRSLVKHRSKVHSIQRSVRCGFCLTVFQTKRHLSSHLRSTHGFVRGRTRSVRASDRRSNADQHVDLRGTADLHTNTSCFTAADSTNSSPLDMIDATPKMGSPNNNTEIITESFQSKSIIPSSTAEDADLLPVTAHQSKSSGDRNAHDFDSQRGVANWLGNLTRTGDLNGEPATDTDEPVKIWQSKCTEIKIEGQDNSTVMTVDPEQDHFLAFLNLNPPRKKESRPIQPERRVLRMTKSRLCPTSTVDDADEKPDVGGSPAETICERSTTSPTAPSPVRAQSPPTSFASESMPNIEQPFASDSSGSPHLSRTQNQLNTALIDQNSVHSRSRRRMLEKPLIEDDTDRQDQSSTPSSSASHRNPFSSLDGARPCTISLISENVAIVIDDQLPLTPSNEKINASSSFGKLPFISPRSYPASASTNRSNLSIISENKGPFSPILRVSVPNKRKSGKTHRTKYQCQFCNHLNWKRSELASHITTNHSDQSLIHLCFSCNCFYDRETFQTHENCQV